LTGGIDSRIDLTVQNDFHVVNRFFLTTSIYGARLVRREPERSRTHGTAAELREAASVGKFDKQALRTQYEHGELTPSRV
jgi:hypothetical protein